MKTAGQRTDKYLVILCLVSVSSLLIFNYLQHWNQLPNGFHNWAQSDRYSVSVRFQENLNFFEPQTHNITSENGRCGVEFPLVQYIAARLNAIFPKTTLPFIYKLLNISILAFGFVYFIRQWPPSEALRSFIGVLMFMTPVLVYYAFNFLPDTASLGIVCLALGLLLKHKEHLNGRNQTIILLVLALATLVKTSSGIYLLAGSASLLMIHVMNKQWKNLMYLIAVSVFAVLVIAGYDYFFFHQVNKAYWSPVFMSSSQPIGSWAELGNVLSGIGFWHGQYITWIQSICIVVLGLVVFVKKFNRKSTDPIQWLVLWSIPGLLAFILLMGKQYINHDYYFIASFYPLIFLCGYYIHSYLTTQRWSHSWGIRLVLLVLIGLAAQHASNQYKHRHGEVFLWKKRGIQNDVIWLRNSTEQLDAIGIPQNATVFVGYAAAPNTSLVYLNRFGKVFNHEEMTRDSSNMAYWYNRIKPDYFIVPASQNMALEQDQPAFYNRLVLFAKRPNMYIYKPI